MSKELTAGDNAPVSPSYIRDVIEEWRLARIQILERQITDLEAERDSLKQRVELLEQHRGWTIPGQEKAQTAGQEKAK